MSVKDNAIVSVKRNNYRIYFFIYKLVLLLNNTNSNEGCRLF